MEGRRKKKERESRRERRIEVMRRKRWVYAKRAGKSRWNRSLTA
jgi:hypothetical protein